MNRWRHGRNARSLHPNNCEMGMLCGSGKKENWGKQSGRNLLILNCWQEQRRELRSRQAFIYDFWCRYSCLFPPDMCLALTFLWMPHPSLSSTGKNWSLTFPSDGEVCDLGSLLYCLYPSYPHSAQGPWIMPSSTSDPLFSPLSTSIPVLPRILAILSSPCNPHSCLQYRVALPTHGF